MDEGRSVELKLSAVGHRYGIREVLSGIDLCVRGGEVVALLGPNGSGKSTLLRAASRALRPTVGAVYFNGHDLSEMPLAKVARELGALEQEVQAGFDFTVREVVELGRLPHLRRLQTPGVHDARAVQNALAKTGMVALADRRVNTLSSGERQRAWLSMVLAQEPRVLLLDEPTAFLDLGFQIGIMEIIVELAAGGLAILMATHDLALATAFAGRLVLMSGGEIIATGSSTDVLTTERVERVYGSSVRLLHDVRGRPVAVAPRSTAANSGPDTRVGIIT